MSTQIVRFRRPFSLKKLLREPYQLKDFPRKPVRPGSLL